jgi:hypothetical protein
MTLEEIRKKYPSAHYAPDPGCRTCGGKGERNIDAGTYTRGGLYPCACVFIGDNPNGMRAEILGAMKRVARRELDRMGGR